MSGKANKQPRRQKHVPQRTCVICRSKTDKRELTRVVNHPTDGVVIDPTGKKNGRGAYICSQLICWEKMVESTILDQALRTSVDPETKKDLQSQYQRNIEVVSHA